MSGIEQKAPANYRAMVEQIVASGSRVFIFASPNVASMPVTIVANVGMLLAWEKGRCMLIDLDIERDAVGRAFQVAEKLEERPKAYQTAVENLHVWPARNFQRADWIKAFAVIGLARSKVDFVLINAPGLLRHPECFRLLHAADGAFVFGEGPDGEITRLVQAAHCTLMKG
jgi:hypothetical protein